MAPFGYIVGMYLTGAMTQRLFDIKNEWLRFTAAFVTLYVGSFCAVMILIHYKP